MDGMTIVNIVLLTILAVGTIAGLFKGLIRQVIELVGVVGSFFVAVLFAGWLAEILEKHLSLSYSPSLVIAFVVIFIGGIIASHFLALSIQKLIRMMFLGWVDRLCGAMLGLIIALIISSLLVSLVLELPVPGEIRRPVENASISLFVRPIAPWLFDFVFSHGDGNFDYRAVFKRGGAI